MKEKDLREGFENFIREGLAESTKNEYSLEDALEKKLGEISIPKPRNINSRSFDPQELIEETKKNLQDELITWDKNA